MNIRVLSAFVSFGITDLTKCESAWARDIRDMKDIRPRNCESNVVILKSQKKLAPHQEVCSSSRIIRANKA